MEGSRQLPKLQRRRWPFAIDEAPSLSASFKRADLQIPTSTTSLQHHPPNPVIIALGSQKPTQPAKWPPKKKSPSTTSQVTNQPPSPPSTQQTPTLETKHIPLPKPDLKNTTDDAIPNYLNSLSFTQSHTLTNTRLALGYSALAIASACFAWDYKLGFDSTKHLTALAVALYTLLNGALTLWVLYVERGTVYAGTAPSGESVRIATTTRKNVPEYIVTVEVTGKGGKKEVVEVRRGFAEWFDAAGRFVAAPFQAMLAGSVAVVGRCDPKRAAAPAGGQGDATGQAGAVYTAEMLEVLAQANASVVGSAAEEASGSEVKKGGKRRKA